MVNFTLQRKINLKALIVVLVVPLLLGVGIHFLHAYQVKRNATSFLFQAQKNRKEGNLEQALYYYDIYTRFVPSDKDAQADYAEALYDRSKKLKTQKSRERAFLALDQAVTRNPNRQDLRRTTVVLAMEIGLFNNARDHLLTMLKEGATKDAGLEKLLGECHARLGEFDKSASLFAQAILHDRSQIDSYEWLAVQLRERRVESLKPGDSDKGEENALLGLLAALDFSVLAFREGSQLSVAPLGPALAGFPFHMLDLMREEPGDRIINWMVQNNSESYKAYVARWRYRTNFKLEGANDDLARARELNPKDADVMLATARMFLGKNELAKARQELTLGLQEHPKNRDMYQLLAATEKALGKPEEAVKVLRKGIDELPLGEQVELIVTLIDLLIDLNQPEEARKESARLGKVEVQPAQTDYTNARFLMEKGEWVDAVQLLEKARPQLVQWPELAIQGHLLRARCYQELGNPDLQLAAAKAAVELDRLRVLSRVTLAASLAVTGNIEEALLEYQLLDPIVPAVRIPMARLLIVKNLRLPIAERRWKEEVDPLLDKAQEALPDSTEVVLLRAQVLAAQEQFPAARKVLEEAQKKNPKKVELWIGLAGLTQHQGEPDGALRLLNQAKVEAGDSAELQLARIRFWTKQGGEPAKQALEALAQDADQLTGRDRGRVLEALAESWIHLGDPKQAEKIYQQTSTQQPRDLRARVHLFDLAVQNDDDAAMKQIVAEIRKIEGEGGTWWRYCEGTRLILRAARNKNKVGLTEAANLLAEVSAKRPTWSRVCLLEGDIFVRQDNFKDAVDKYQRAMLLGETRPAIVERVVRLLYTNGKYAEAQSTLAKLPADYPLRGSLGRIAVDLALREGDTKQALELAQKVAESTDYADYLWYAEFLWKQGQKDKVEAILQQALKVNNKVPQTYVAWATYLLQAGRKGEVVKLLDKARTDLPKDQRDMGLAQLYDLLGDREQAGAHYKAALDGQSDDPMVLMNVASFYVRTGQSKQAETLLRKITGTASKAPPEIQANARRLLALALSNRGDHQAMRQVVTLLEENRKTLGDRPEDLKLLATILSTQPTRRKEALKYLRMLDEKDMASPDDRFLLAQMCEIIEGWLVAKNHLLELVESPQGKKAPYLAYLVNGMLKRGEDLKETAAWFKKLKAIAPDSLETVQLEVLLLKKQEKTKDAIDVVHSYEAKTKGANPLVIGTLLEELGQTAEAEAKFVQYYEANKDKRPEGVLPLIGFLGRQGKTDEALKYCKKAWETCAPERAAVACTTLLQNTKGDRARYFAQVEKWIQSALAKKRTPGLLSQFAGLYYLQNDFTRAEALFREALVLDPNHATAANNRAWLLAMDQKKFKEAEELIDQAIERHGPVPDMLGTRGYILLAQKKYDEAVKSFKEVVAEDPSPLNRFRLAHAYLWADSKGFAAEQWRLAKEDGFKADMIDPLEGPALQKVVSELGGVD